MRYRHWLVSLTLGTGMVASPALAGETAVVFDLSTSRTSVSGFPLGAVTVGTAMLTVQADGPSTPLPGPATLSDLSISMEIFAPIVPGATLSGQLSVVQRMPATGNLTPDLGQVQFETGALAFDIMGTIDCAGSLCSVLGPLPIVIQQMFVNTAPQSFSVAQLNGSSGAMLLGSLSFSSGTILGSGMIGVMGTELTRVFDPGDTDGDGIPDADDRCPNSILDATVVIDTCDSGVPNALTADGCSITDQVLACDQGGNHGSFVSCVARLRKTLDLKGSQNGAIQSCAARSSR